MPVIAVTLPSDGDDAIVEPYNTAILLIQSVLNGGIDANNLAAGAVTLAALSTAVQGALVPTGLISAYGGSTAPTGYLMCDGSSYLRASYSALFAVVGTSYGSADGTHFNVPDLRGRVPVGADALGGSAANRIQRSTTLSTTSGSPTATVASATGLSRGMYITNSNVPAGTTITIISGTTITMSANASATGATVAARFSLIGNDAQLLGAAGGTDVTTIVTDQMPSHTHGVGAASNGAGSLQFSGHNGTDITTVLTTATGGDQPHSVISPSVTTSYVIKT